MPETPPPLPPFVITVDGADLCDLALGLPTEAEQDARLVEIVQKIREAEGQV